MCSDVYYVRKAKVDTYWCSSSKNTQYSGYLFGGLYSSSLPNPVTKSKSCPSNFLAVKLLTNGLMACLSNDYETGTRFAIPFGGFFSCKSGNPLIGGHHKCPPTFSQHLAGITDGCEVLYCVQSGIFTGGQLLPIHLPPFTQPSITYTLPNNRVVVMREGDRAWVRVGDMKTWKPVEPDEIEETLEQFNNFEMSGVGKFGIAVGVLTLVSLVIGGVVIAMRRRRRIASGQDEISNEVQIVLYST